MQTGFKSYLPLQSSVYVFVFKEEANLETKK